MVDLSMNLVLEKSGRRNVVRVSRPARAHAAAAAAVVLWKTTLLFEQQLLELQLRQALLVLLSQQQLQLQLHSLLLCGRYGIGQVVAMTAVAAATGRPENW
jgi:hypothetical protein